MFVLSKWKRWCLDARKDIASFRRRLDEADKENSRLMNQVNKLQTSFNRVHPRWGEYEYIEMAMDLFNKYCKQCRQSGKLEDGRTYYWYTPENGGGRDMKVVPCKELPDGYMRYMQKYEEPHRECVYCGKKFTLLNGYPAKNARFCEEKCFNHHVWAQEERSRKEKKQNEGKDS